MTVTLSTSRTTSERGYILLAMLLFVALLAIAAAAIAPTIAFQVRRDHEEELIHRGVQYSRAVKHYFKKFNRYPTRIEDLESSNKFRFLRKAYKDPITGKDFKVLYQSQVQAMGIGAGGGLASANVGAAGGGATGLPASSFGANAGAGAKPTSTSASDDAGGSQTGSANSGSTNPNASVTSGGTDSVESGPGTGKVFGGGPIVGVVSTSKAQSIRAFNNKDHYNQWLFIYDPTTDTGGLLNTPAQPAIQGAVPAAGQSAIPGGAAGSPFGNQGTGNQPQNPGLGTQPPQSSQP